MKTHCTYLPIPDDFKKKLKSIQESLLEEAQQLNLETVDLDKAQLTLSVFRLSEERREDPEEEVLNTAKKQLSDYISEKRPRVQLQVTGLNSFGPRVLFVQVDFSNILDELREDVNELMEAEGIEVFDNRFVPHISLFRLREGSKGDDNEVVRLVTDHSNDAANLGCVTVHEVHFKKICALQHVIKC